MLVRVCRKLKIEFTQNDLLFQEETLFAVKYIARLLISSF
jgi:hypothetical protein